MTTDEALIEWDKLTANSVWGLEIYIYAGGIEFDKVQEKALGVHHYRVHAVARNSLSSSANHGIFVRTDSVAECIERLISYLKSAPKEFEMPGVSFRINLNEEKI